MRLTPRKHPSAGYATPETEVQALAQRASRHMAMRGLRIQSVHGANCACTNCTVRKHAKAVR